MEVYTGKQLADILQQEDADMNLRTVRYYTQIGMLPPLELVGNKRVYTGRHLEYLRAILTLSKSGESLADIQVKLEALSPEEIAGLGARLKFYQPQHILQHETLVINDDVMLTVSPQITPEQRSEMIEAVTRLLRGENKL